MRVRQAYFTAVKLELTEQTFHQRFRKCPRNVVIVAHTASQSQTDNLSNTCGIYQKKRYKKMRNKHHKVISVQKTHVGIKKHKTQHLQFYTSNPYEQCIESFKLT